MTSLRASWTTSDIVLAGTRLAVGTVLLICPQLATEGDDDRKVLVRTIGIRDVVLASTAPRIDDLRLRRSWLRRCLASDLADVALAVLSARSIGTRGTLIAALAPAPLIAIELRALMRRSPYPTS